MWLDILSPITAPNYWCQHKLSVFLEFLFELRQQRWFAGNRIVSIPLPKEWNDGGIDHQFVHRRVCGKSFWIGANVDAVSRPVVLCGHRPLDNRNANFLEAILVVYLPFSLAEDF